MDTFFVVVLTAFGFGFASACFPLLNAEAYTVVNAAAFGEATAPLFIVSLAVGTALGKVVIFEGARAGKRAVKKRAAATGPPRGRVVAAFRRTTEVLESLLERPIIGSVTVVTSSFVGIPPLLAVAALAGMSRQNVWLFAAAVTVGRAARFALIAYAVIEVG